MIFNKKDDNFNYTDNGDGPVFILLHGLLGGLSNFEKVSENLVENGYRAIIPILPLYSLPLLKTNVKNLTNYIHKLVLHLGLDKFILIGNSLGGHISLMYAKEHPERLNGLVLTGSSGLYENSMGNSYPKRGDYEYIKRKAKEVFYDPNVATKELVDDVYEIVNSRSKAIKILYIAKSAIRHNMAKDVVNMQIPTCLIWGESDIVTPTSVAEEFHKLLPQSELHWISKCGHAAMMERPEEFNAILNPWAKKILS